LLTVKRVPHAQTTFFLAKSGIWPEEENCGLDEDRIGNLHFLKYDKAV
jgi:hypothetical protein